MEKKGGGGILAWMLLLHYITADKENELNESELSNTELSE